VSRPKARPLGVDTVAGRAKWAVPGRRQTPPWVARAPPGAAQRPGGGGVPSDASPTSRHPLDRHEPITTTLTLAGAAQIMREAVKDKSYRATPLGLLVGRYLRWFRNEWGATASTIRDYELILARMALTLADKEPLEVTVEDLRDVIDLWADREARTRAKVTRSSGPSGPGPKTKITCRSRRLRSFAGRERRARAPRFFR
jgi:hypothetical protein